MRIKIPKDPMNDYRLDEWLIKSAPIDVKKIHAARLKIGVINEGAFSPDWFKEKQNTDNEED